MGQLTIASEDNAIRSRRLITGEVEIVVRQDGVLDGLFSGIHHTTYLIPGTSWAVQSDTFRIIEPNRVVIWIFGLTSTKSLGEHFDQIYVLCGPLVSKFPKPRSTASWMLSLL